VILEPIMTDDIKDDLAYVKALAEEGRDTPLVGGVFFVIWGGLMGLAALLVYAGKARWIELGPAGDYAPWLAALIIGWGLSIFFGRRIDLKPGATTLGNRTANAVWLSVGLFMTGLWLTIMFVHDNFTALGVPPYFLFHLIAPIGFGLYGVAFVATAAAARVGWLKWFVPLAWICAALSLALMGDDRQYLVMAIGLFLSALAPGLILMRRAPSEVV